jgi:copper(I)-binding protein
MSTFPRPSVFRRVTGTMVALGALGLLAAACGSDTKSSSSTVAVTSAPATKITVTGAWARTTAVGAKNGAIYFTIVTPVDDQLLGVKIDASVAARAEMHETVAASADTTAPGNSMTATTMMGAVTTMMGSGPTTMMGASTTMGPSTSTTMAGEMTMKPVASIDLQANAAFTFEPGGYHVMLFDLVKPLTKGTTITLTLTLKSEGTFTIDVPVLESAP